MRFNKKYFLINILLFVLACGIGTYFRLIPLLDHTSNDASEKATLLVLANLRSKITSTVEQKYPHIKGQEKDLLIKKLLDDLLHKDGSQARATIENISKNIEKSGQADQTTPYLLASDSFYYYGLTKKILETSTFSDTIQGSKYLNRQMLAPSGHFEPLNWHPYIGIWTYNIARLFNPNIDLMSAISYTPIIIAALALIPFFILCALLECSPLVTFVSALFFQLSPIFIKRSTFGWYDNDPYSIFFPLLILSIFFLMLKKIPTKRVQSFILTIITFLLITLYAFFWQGWVLMFSIILCSLFLILLFQLIFLRLKTPQIKNETSTSAQTFLLFLIGGFTAISLVFGKSEFVTLFQEGWRALANFLTPQLSLWPDLFISVGELHKASLSFLIELTGGVFFFSIACLGLIAGIGALLKKAFTKQSINTVHAYQLLTILVFFMAAFLISLGAQRFAILCLIPLSLAFPLGLQTIIKAISSLVKTKSTMAQNSLKIALSICLLSISIFPINAMRTSLKSLLTPIYNDTWDATMTEIRERTEKNAIINTWWPPGHFIKAMGERSVTFDGATINFPQAYWLANVFLSTDEKTAAGLLRMLNGSANKAADYLLDLGLKHSQAVGLLKEATRRNTFESRMILTGSGLNNEQANDLLALTHTKPRPSYVLIYKEFVDNNIQLKFIGHWNFKAIERINADPIVMAKVPKPGSKMYIDFLWTLAGGQPKYSNELREVSRINDSVLFEHNITINLQTLGTQINSPKFGRGIPLSIFFMEGNQMKERKFDNATLSYSVILFNRGNKFSCVLAERSFAQSLLTQLYFFEGHGLKYFEPFTQKSDLTRRTEIMVYKVNWARYIADLEAQ